MRKVGSLKLPNIKLTVLVPSRAPSKKLDALVKELRRQRELHKKDVQLVLSINEAEPLVDPNWLHALGPDWKVIFFNGPRDYDSHLDWAVGQCDGEFVKILADDDMPTENMVGILLHALNQFPKAKALVHDFRIEGESSDSEELSKNVPELFSKSLMTLEGRWGQVSSTLFKREAWCAVESPKEQTDYIHVFKLLAILCNFGEDSGVSVRGKLVVVRLGAPNFSASTRHRLLVAYRGVRVHDLVLKNQCRLGVVQRELRKNLLYFARTLAFAKADSREWHNDLATKILRSHTAFKENLAVLMVALLPPSFLASVRQFRKAKHR